jgi:long-chain acyl-CoA synthetase
MSEDRARPWLRLYNPGVPDRLPAPGMSPLSSFLATVARSGDRAFLHYFDRIISFSEADRMSSALASSLRSRGVTAGDRVALYTQNDPDFAIAQLAAWKLGAISVSVNPMLRDQELEHILIDSGAKALVVLEELWDSVARHVVGRVGTPIVLITRPTDWTAAAPGSPHRSGTVGDRPEALMDTLERSRDVPFETASPSLDDIACISYTSGTSGRPKGVPASHMNLACSAEVYRTWACIDESDVFLCGAPIFHITGITAGLALSYLSGMSVVLFHRFDPEACLKCAEQCRATFTVMAITAFQSLLQQPAIRRYDLSALTKVYSGGAPVSPAISAQWRAISGKDISSVYGLTETTGPTHAVPLGRAAPIDASSGALAAGLPLPSVEARIVDPQSLQDAPVGEPGEIWVRGPMVMDGYWGLPAATHEAFVDGYFRTGDVGVRDADGWFYVVDRLKDMINASGYKVWPREVEEFLLQHPAVAEVAVVGVADEYRGETVKAFVVLRANQVISPEEIIAFAKTRMAAYKYPRLVEFVGALPKTASGKVLRREMRGAHRGVTNSP